jgi:hypothetical protein
MRADMQRLSGLLRDCYSARLALLTRLTNQDIPCAMIIRSTVSHNDSQRLTQAFEEVVRGATSYVCFMIGPS